MANPVWPLSLPSLPRDTGYGEQPPELSLRSPMDVGPAKVRRRQTAGVRPLQAQLILTEAQVETLDQFYVTGTESGALVFDWVNPRTEAAAELRFVGPPRYTPLSGDVVWRADLTLEILP